MRTRWVAAGMVASLAFGMAAPVTMASAATTTTGKATTTTKAPAKPKKKRKPKLPTPHIGQAAADGDFSFTVTGVQCGVTTIGTSPLTEAAPAGTQWCLATMTVKNIKSGAQTFGATNQKAIDGHGNTLTADADALIYIPNGTSEAFETVNPGVSITAVVPYQLPSNGKITKFILHDSILSGGVTVYNVG